MSKISILGLGGLDEKNKNMYVLEVDSKIYIIDAGVYEPLTNDFGIEHYTPKLDYLIENKDKVKAIFLSSSNRQQIGALPQLVRNIPNIKIYGSEETVKSLPFLFGEKVKEWNTEEVQSKIDHNLSGIKVMAIRLAASIPGTFGYVFKTNDGNIIYFTDYIFDSIEEYPSIDLIDSLTSLSNEDNLLFMSDSLNSFIKPSIAPLYRITKYVEKIFKTGKRIFASVYEDDIINIVELINLAKENKYKISFIDKDFEKVIKVMQSTGKIIEFPFKDINSTSQGDTNLLLIATGTRTNLYSKLDYLIEDGINEKNSLTEEDVVAILSPPQAGNEDHHQDISNKISRIDPTLITVSTKEKLNTHPSQFDLKNYLIFLKPTYFMPIKGYYKELKTSAKVATEYAGMESKNVILADAGEIFEFYNKTFKGLSRRVKEVGNAIIEAVNYSGMDGSVLDDRASLGKDGVLTLSVLINKDSKELLSNIDVQMKGVVFVKSQEQLMEKIEKLVKITIEENKVEWKNNKVISVINKELSKILRAEIKKVPTMVIQIKEI